MSGTRVPLAALALLALFVAGWAGLARLGLVAGPPGPATVHHGALIVSGFAGTLIGLERSIVLQRRWGILAPLGSAVGTGALVLGAPAALAVAGVLAGAVAFVAVALAGGPVSPRWSRGVMSIGAAAWIVGAVLWMTGADAFRLVPWWVLFLVLAITGERIDLSRSLRPTPLGGGFLGVVIAVMTGAVLLTLVDFTLGLRMLGGALAAIAVWLAVHERPIDNVGAHGLRRYVAVAATVAYGWLVVGAFLFVTFDGAPAGWRYDAAVHAVFVGMVMTTIFGHLALVVPAVLGMAATFRSVLYVPLAMLEGSVLLRVAGDLLERADVRDAGAIGVALSVAVAIAAMASGLRARRRVARSPR